MRNRSLLAACVSFQNNVPSIYIGICYVCVMKEHVFDCHRFPSFLQLQYQMCEIGRFELLFVSFS